MREGIRWCALAAAAGLALGLAVRAVGQPAASTIGYVDLARLHQQSQAYKKAREELRSFGEAKREELRLHEVYKYLTGDEAKRAVELGMKINLTTEERKELIALRTKNTNNSLQMSQLLQKTNRTPQEERRLQELQTLMKERAKELEQLRAQANKQVADKQQEWNDKLLGAVDRALAQTARELNLSIILQKRVNFEIRLPDQQPVVAGDNVVLWGGQDVTDRLIQLIDQLVLQPPQ